MEDQMDTEPIEQRGTKRLAEEAGTQEPPKPKKIKVRKRVLKPIIEPMLMLPAGSGSRCRQQNCGRRNYCCTNARTEGVD